jgi:putative two-component system response regulator
MTHHSAGRILVVDDEPIVIELITRLMVRFGFEVDKATNGGAALEAVVREPPDVVLLDVNMPDMDGFEVCRRLKRDATSRLIPVVLLTALTSVEDRIRGLDAGADDFLSKPFVAAELEARVRSLAKLKRYTDSLDSAESVIFTLAETIEARDPYTRGHCERLARYAASFGAHLGLSGDDQLALYRGGFLHDVGKVALADAILLKPGRLDASEQSLMQQHPVVGDAICRGLRLLDDVRPIVRHHHERADGTGYPDGLSGSDIPLLAQLMSIADAYDAMTTERPYKPAKTFDAACGELRGEAEKGWKRIDLIDAFVAIASRPELLVPNHDLPLALRWPVDTPTAEPPRRGSDAQP